VFLKLTHLFSLCPNRKNKAEKEKEKCYYTALEAPKKKGNKTDKNNNRISKNIFKLICQ
jgi:hypothetical protein